MTIDVSELLKRKITNQNINLVIDRSEIFVHENEFQCKRPIELDGVITLVGDILKLDCTINTELSIQCSRCMEEYAYTVDHKLHEEFSNNPDNEDDNIIFIDSDKIDIIEVIENNIIITLPIKRLCSENCKGLCQHCGTNLNINTCNCDNKDVDPRLAKLRDLFSTD